VEKDREQEERKAIVKNNVYGGKPWQQKRKLRKKQQERKQRKKLLEKRKDKLKASAFSFL